MKREKKMAEVELRAGGDADNTRGGVQKLGNHLQRGASPRTETELGT